MINFLKYKKLYFLISTVVILLGLFSIFRYGFKLSIDFIGGSLIEYRLDQSMATHELENFFKKKNIEVFSISKTKDTYLIRSKVVDVVTEDTVRKDITKTKNIKVEQLRFETVGPTLGRETLIKTGVASIIAILGILIYLTFAFKNLKYGSAAILAMLHDFLVVIGSYSLMSHFFGAEVDTLFVTALLTTMSFSVHDTIVVFDKIREDKKSTSLPFEALANKALTETMVRSLNNSLTIILMLTALLLLGGETIRFFVATLLIGTITGTYSSPFTATPILAHLEGRKN